MARHDWFIEKPTGKGIAPVSAAGVAVLCLAPTAFIAAAILLPGWPKYLVCAGIGLGFAFLVQAKTGRREDWPIPGWPSSQDKDPKAGA